MHNEMQHPGKSRNYPVRTESLLYRTKMYTSHYIAALPAFIYS